MKQEPTISVPDALAAIEAHVQIRALWARSKAAARPENAAIADDLKRMYLRDMRKRSADLAGSVEDAQKLLQHDDPALTRKHYRSKVETLKPAR